MEQDFWGNQKIEKPSPVIWKYPQNRTWQTIDADGERILFWDLRFFTLGEPPDLPFQQFLSFRE